MHYDATCNYGLDRSILGTRCCEWIKLNRFMGGQMHIQGTRFSCCFESFGPMRKEKYNTYRRDWIDGLDCGALANPGASQQKFSIFFVFFFP